MMSYDLKASGGTEPRLASEAEQQKLLSILYHLP
jgi:hypothetical protein